MLMCDSKPPISVATDSLLDGLYSLESTVISDFTPRRLPISDKVHYHFKGLITLHFICSSSRSMPSRGSRQLIVAKRGSETETCIKANAMIPVRPTQ